MKTVVAIMVLLLVAQTTSPQIPHSVPPGTTDHIMFESGNALLRKCQSTQQVDTMFCIWYILGVVDLVGLIQGSIDKDGKSDWKYHAVCLSSQVERGQMRDVVLKYLVDHPERRDEPAAQLVVVALIKAWACPVLPNATNP
jgi:Rap1a immunity proteins